MTGRERRYDEEQQTNCCFRVLIPAERWKMGEPNNALKVYMRRADRIRSVLEYYVGGKLPEELKGLFGGYKVHLIHMRRIPKSAFDVIDVCTRIKDIRSCIKFEQNQEDGEEEGDMCKALNEIQRNARNKGKAEGRMEGRAEGRAEEIVEGGFEYGLSEESIMERLQRKLNLSEGKARDYLKKYRKRLV